MILILTLTDVKKAYATGADIPVTGYTIGEILIGILSMCGITLKGTQTLTNKEELITYGELTVEDLQRSIQADGYKGFNDYLETCRDGEIDTSSVYFDYIKEYASNIHNAIKGAVEDIKVLLPGQLTGKRIISGLNYRDGLIYEMYVYGDDTVVFGRGWTSYWSLYGYSQFNVQTLVKDSTGRVIEIKPLTPVGYRDIKIGQGTIRVYGMEFDYYNIGATQNVIPGDYTALNPMGNELTGSISMDWFLKTYSNEKMDKYLRDLEKARDWQTVGGVNDLVDRDGTLDNLGLQDKSGSVVRPKEVVGVDWDGIKDQARDKDNAIGDTIAQVIDGTIPWDRWITDVGVIPWDRVIPRPAEDDKPAVVPIELVRPKPDEPTTPTAPDGLNYMMKLDEIFPFCLPFDAIKFVNCLSANPKAPRFEIPLKIIPFKSGGYGDETVVIDLKDFDGVASLLRKLQLMLFIVGLAVVTRSKFIRG